MGHVECIFLKKIFTGVPRELILQSTEGSWNMIGKFTEPEIEGAFSFNFNNWWTVSDSWMICVIKFSILLSFVENDSLEFQMIKGLWMEEQSSGLQSLGKTAGH